MDHCRYRGKGDGDGGEVDGDGDSDGGTTVVGSHDVVTCHEDGHYYMNYHDAMKLS